MKSSLRLSLRGAGSRSHARTCQKSGQQLRTLDRILQSSENQRCRKLSAENSKEGFLMSTRVESVSTDSRLANKRMREKGYDRYCNVPSARFSFGKHEDQRYR